MEPERIDAGVKSVRFALDIFELVAFSGEAMGVTQIANRVRLTKGSAHRHLTTLVECGYLTQSPLTSRYEIGPKTQLLARVAPEFDLAKLSEGPMLELRDETGQSVVLSAMTPRGALVVRTIGGMSPIEIGVRPGSELAFHASAQGKILLAHAPRPVQKRVLEAALSAWTDRTATGVAAVEEELSRVLQRGYASAPEETMLGINALAAPIFDGTDACVASVALVGSIQFLPAVPDTMVVSKLIACGQDISRRLGFRTSQRSTQGFVAERR
jgi:IclR family KDG regulon transcriptional repressor